MRGNVKPFPASSCRCPFLLPKQIVISTGGGAFAAAVERPPYFALCFHPRPSANIQGKSCSYLVPVVDQAEGCGSVQSGNSTQRRRSGSSSRLHVSANRTDGLRAGRVCDEEKLGDSIGPRVYKCAYPGAKRKFQPRKDLLMCPKVSHPATRSLLILLSLAVVCSSARAENITFNIPFDDPFEGNDGKLNFTVTNTGTVNITIESVELAPRPSTSQSFAFTGIGERDDEVTGTMISPIGNTCEVIGAPKNLLNFSAVAALCWGFLTRLV